MIKTIAERLTEMKKDAGISNRKLSEISGVPEGTVNSILSGNTVRPSFDDVNAMVTAMGRSIDELLGEPQTPTEVHANVIDHYTLLIESYKGQLEHYRDQVNAMRQANKERDAAHKEQLANHRKGLWFLLIVMTLMVAFMCYLCIDATHGNWGIFRYPVQ